MSEEQSLAGYELVARLVHVSDTHVMDEESPARFAGAHDLVHSAWRPYEAYSSQLLDGIVRVTNRLHASGRNVDFVLHSGDACDNSQQNELAWFLDILDGNEVSPLSGPDDRQPEDIPGASLDPHAPFTPEGLWRQDVQGSAPTIPWYIVFGNHDRFSIGVFQIVEDFLGRRTAPLPFAERPGVVLPNYLDPLAGFAHGNVTPADPGPPDFLNLPSYVAPNAERRFFNRREFIQAMFTTLSQPVGHGFADADSGPSWYSVAPVPGLRLIGLDTCEPLLGINGFPYQDGSILAEQVAFLQAELAAATERSELVIVASHHPSASLWDGYGSALIGSTFRALLNEYPNVILHLAGHSHINRVKDRTGYIEIETCSTIDLPQEARIIEIWRNAADQTVAIKYEMLSHLDDTLPLVSTDPLRAMREQAYQIASQEIGGTARLKADEAGAKLEGESSDRNGVRYLKVKR